MTKVLRHFCISRALSNSHRSNPSSYKQCWMRVSRILFRVSTLCRVGEGKKISKRMHCLMREPRNDRKITILQYCPRDFCPWLKLCRFRKGSVHTNPDRLKPNIFFSHEKTFLPSLRSLKKSTLKSQSNPHGFRYTKR